MLWAGGLRERVLKQAGLGGLWGPQVRRRFGGREGWVGEGSLVGREVGSGG